MGIYRLTTRLLHKAQRLCWSTSPQDDTDNQGHSKDKIAIIDGPSFAHHVYYRFLSNSVRTPSLSLTYHALNQALITALEELEALGFEIEHIYFDGVLPSQKVSTRILRLGKYASQNAAVRLKHDRSLNSRRDPIELDAFLQHARHDKQLPPPPFLVSSMIEALCFSRYANVAEVVSDEAELYCAKAAEKLGDEQLKPIFIFTNDSDIFSLVSGCEAQVVLLEHMDRRKASCGAITVQALVLHPAQLIRDAELPNLVAVAGVMEEDPHCSFEAATSRVAAHVQSVTSTANAYPAASILLHEIGHRQKQLLRFCDPRTAEVLYQFLSKQTDRTIDIFLPFLLDDPLRASAWHCGTTFRNTSIAILLQFMSQPQQVREYDRKATKFMPKSLDMDSDLSDELHSTTFWLGQHCTALRACSTAEKWRTIGMIALLGDLSARDMTLPGLNRVQDAISSTEVSRTWDMVHLRAQWHATLYSIRFLKTIVSFVIARHRDLKVGREEHVATQMPALLDLERIFSDMPTMPALFDTADGAPDESSQSHITSSYEIISTASAEELDVDVVDVADSSHDDDDEQPDTQSSHYISNNRFSLLSGH